MNANRRDDVLASVESIISDPQPSPAALRWMREGFKRHLETGQPLTKSLGIDQACPQGLWYAHRNRKFAEHIARAVSVLEPTGSVHSTAKLIGQELARLSRRRRPQPAASEFERCLLDALQAHPMCPTAPTSLWPTVAAAYEKLGIQSVTK